MSPDAFEEGCEILSKRLTQLILEAIDQIEAMEYGEEDDEDDEDMFDDDMSDDLSEDVSDDDLPDEIHGSMISISWAAILVRACMAVSIAELLTSVTRDAQQLPWFWVGTLIMSGLYITFGAPLISTRKVIARRIR